ncbi:MAG: hypothetical protein HKN29_08190 [Rhodothermales bacterium]|nr:hypothetical protein [Rhodothermales bacterium]
MGKAALILVTAVTVASGVVYMNQDRTSLGVVEQEALYEHQVLAREIAQSGFNRLESRVRRDFHNHRPNQDGLAHSRGQLDLLASTVSSASVTISATGHFEDAEYTISGTLSKSGTRILDALTIDGVLAGVTMASGAKISGIDTNPDGTSGENMDVHAVLTDEASSYTDLLTGIVSGNAPGTGGLLDIVNDDPEISLSTLAANINAFSGAARQDYDGATTLNDQTLGSADSPVLIVADGDLTISGSTTGYGILYVNGDLSFGDTAQWNGLVMVDNDGGDHVFTGSSRVYGAVIIRSVYGSGDDGDGGLPGGHFDVDVFDEFGAGEYRYHQHKYDDEYDATGIDLLDPTGCGSGGLCWDSILGDEEAVYVEFMNADMGYGTYEIVADEGTTTGTCTAGAGDPYDSYVMEDMPDDVRMAGFSGGGWFNALSAQLLTLFDSNSNTATATADDDDDDGGMVEVCHNGKTKTVNESALQAHLDHGDTEGACGSSDDDDDGGSDDDDDGGSGDDDDGAGSGDDDDDGGSGDDDGDAGGSDDGSCTDGGATIPAANLTGNTHEGLSPTLIDARAVTTFQVNFEYLCALQISSPNGVIYDPTDRNDAFTVRIYSASHNGSSWSQGDLVYETSVYHHTGYGWDYNPGGTICDPTSASDGTVAGEPMNLEMGGTAQIQYSSQTLYKVRDLISQVNPGQGSIRLQSVREEGVRPTRFGIDQ